MIELEHKNDNGEIEYHFVSLVDIKYMLVFTSFNNRGALAIDIGIGKEDNIVIYFADVYKAVEMARWIMSKKSKKEEK